MGLDGILGIGDTDINLLAAGAGHGIVPVPFLVAFSLLFVLSDSPFFFMFFSGVGVASYLFQK